MKALSIHAPYIHDIITGSKKEEYRTWKPKEFGRILLCSSAKRYPGYASGYALCTVEVLCFLCLYLFAFVLSLFVDFGLRHISFSGKNLCIVFFRSLKEDIISPLLFLKELLSNILSYITHLMPIKRKYIWHSNRRIVVFAVIYLLIAVLEVIALSRIIGYGINEWSELIKNGVTRFR